MVDVAPTSKLALPKDHSHNVIFSVRFGVHNVCQYVKTNMVPIAPRKVIASTLHWIVSQVRAVRWSDHRTSSHQNAGGRYVWLGSVVFKNKTRHGSRGRLDDVRKAKATLYTQRVCMCGYTVVLASYVIPQRAIGFSGKTRLRLDANGIMVVRTDCVSV